MNYCKQYSAILLLLASFSMASAQQPGRLLWSEEFDYTGLPDTTIWTYDVGNGCPNICGWGNQEVQFYTEKDPRNARVEDGKLIIEAHRDADGRWTSARLKTQGKKTFRYGRIQFRAKLPAGSGTWPALWMLGEDITTVGWPRCGEIDVMEHVGRDPGRVQAAMHTPSSHGNTQDKGGLMVPDFDRAFHVYEVRWTPRKIAFYLDGKNYYTYKPKQRNAETWPYDQPFFIIVNIAMGGGFGRDPQYETGGLKNGIEPGLTTARMEVDYIRLYRR